MLRLLSSARNLLQGSWGSRASSSLSIRITRKTEAEPAGRYEVGGNHPVKPGERYNEHYQTVRQLGWGRYSTVWLVRDVRTQNLAAMKILVGDLTSSNDKSGWDELGVLKILRDSNARSAGYPHICQLLDDFTHQGPNGIHKCFILESMGLNVFDLSREFPGAMPMFLVQRISKHILRALQYLHEDCGVVHTDLKGDNILMTTKTIPEVGQEAVEVTLDELKSTTFKLTDFGAANKMSARFAEVIQPAALRAPEVIIGAEWDTKTDIWNFGCLIYEFLRGTKLFDPFWNNKESGMRPAQTHLAQMVGLLGEFPHGLLAMGSRTKDLFDDDGHLLKSGNYAITLEDLLSRAAHSPEDLPAAAEFLSCMLVINPEDRWSAAQLLNHPWIRDVD